MVGAFQHSRRPTIPRLVLLSVLLALALAFSGQTPSALPQTQPGLGRDEGVFLATTADDGSRAIYFVARGARHSIMEADLQAELRTNPLWPVRSVERDEVLAYPEASPVGSARAGLLGSVLADASPEELVAEAVADASSDGAVAEAVADAGSDGAVAEAVADAGSDAVAGLDAG